MEDDERSKLIGKLRTLLGAGNLRPFDLEVFEEGVRREGEWWYVPISPQKDNVRTFDYAPLLNEIEERFELEGTKLLLIPASGLTSA